MERDMILQDYEETIKKQAALLKKQQAAIDNLHEELSSVHSKLLTSGKHNQKKVEGLIQQIHQSTAQDSSEDSYLFKQELEAALKEKEISQAESKRHALEVQRLRQEIVSFQSISNDGSQVPGTQVKDYESVIRALEEETNRLRAEVSKMEDEKMEVMRVNLGLKKQISSLEFQLDQDGQEIDALRNNAQQKERATQEVKEAYAKLNKQLVDQSEDLRTLVAQTKILQKSKDQLSRVVMTVNEKLKEAKQRVSESVRIAEDALLEKDAALLREKHALNEVSRLDSTVASLMVEAGEKAQNEISKIKDDYNKNIKNMSQEVVRLEMALNEKELECSKAKKEQVKATKVLEPLHAEIIRKKEAHQDEILNYHQRISSLENRVIALSAERDDISALNMRIAQEHENQRVEFLARIEELEQRLLISKRDFETLRIEYEETRRQASSISEELERVKEERNTRDKYLNRQLLIKMEELEELASSSRARLDATDSCHREITSQLNENMNALQESYSKLQAQMLNQRRAYEERVEDNTKRLQDSVLKYKNALQSMHEVKTELAVTKDLASQYKLRIEETEARLHSAELRFTTLRSKSVLNCDNHDVS